MAFIAASLLFRDDGLDFGETKPGFTALTDGRLHVETFDEHPVCLMEADEVAALFRYLAGIVLPKVERADSFDSHTDRLTWRHFVADPKPDKGKDGIRDTEWAWLSLGDRRMEVAPVVDQMRLTADQARALAACLLVAADEADTTETTTEEAR